MTKKLCPDSAQNYAEICLGARSRDQLHFFHFFQIPLKIIDRNQKAIQSGLKTAPPPKKSAPHYDLYIQYL